MKLKNLLISACISLTSVSAFSMSNGEAGILGIIIGSHMTRQHEPMVIVQPQVQVQREVIIISPSQAPYFNSTNHGYCAPYEGTQYASCMGAARKRQEMDEAYSRGYYGR